MIQLTADWVSLVNVAGGAAMVVFGAWVLTLTPRTRSSRMLAVFALAAGSLYVVNPVTEWQGWALFVLFFPYFAVVGTAGGLALLGLTRELLEPHGDRRGRLWGLALLSAAVLVLVPLATEAANGFASTSAFVESQGAFEAWRLASVLAFSVGGHLFFGAMLVLPLVLSRVYRHPPEGSEDRARGQAALVSGSLVLWPAFITGAQIVDFADPSATVGTSAGLFDVFWILMFVGLLALVALWLANAQAVPWRGREAQAVALLTAGVLLSGMVNSVFLEPVLPQKGPIWGVVRLAAVVGLAYAVLRHDFLGVEAKFRWGLSKTTVAGVFVAVFFVVSEGAQVLFAGFAGSEFLGVLAAGALVFFLAPIQRAADELAEAVVPGGGSTDTSAAQAEKTYRKTVEDYLSDGELTTEEEHHLGRLAGQLDVDAERALELREQVEDGLEAGGDGG